MSLPTSSSTPFSLNFTKLSKGIAVILATGYIVQLIAPTSRQYLCLVAGRFIPCVWNVFTAGLIETNVLQLVFSILSILLLARIIEPIWGSKEFLKFLGIVNLGTGIAALAVLYICFVINSTIKERAGKVLYMEVNGFHGVVAACLVAVKQLIPDTEVTLLRIIRFHAKHLPGLYLLISTASGVFFHNVLVTVPFIVSSTLVAWIYLRHFQVKPGLTLRGDPGNEFRFATFFPEFAQPAVDKITGLFSRGQAEGSEATGQAIPSGSALGSESSEAARRRERGAKVLEERLTASSSKPQASQTQRGDVESGEAAESRPDNGLR